MRYLTVALPYAQRPSPLREHFVVSGSGSRSLNEGPVTNERGVMASSFIRLRLDRVVVFRESNKGIKTIASLNLCLSINHVKT